MRIANPSLLAAGAIVTLALASCSSTRTERTTAQSLGYQPTFAPFPALEEEVVTDDGYTVTKSGLEYKAVTEGSGPKPSAASVVTVNYEGKLDNGTKFDSSYDRGQPATFPLNGVIRGWTEGVQLMSLGSTYMFRIPPELGYGMRGAPGSIPPNATLNFKVELISFQ